MHFKEYQDVIKHIDWKLLQQQKKTLEKLLNSLPLCKKISNVPDKHIFDLWE